MTFQWAVLHTAERLDPAESGKPDLARRACPTSDDLRVPGRPMSSGTATRAIPRRTWGGAVAPSVELAVHRLDASASSQCRLPP